VEDLDDCWPPPPPPPHEEPSQVASDLFLASMLLDLNPDDLDAQEASHHPPNFASLFDNQLTIPPHMGAINEKKVALQRRRNVSYFKRDHQSPGFGASGLVATAACRSSGQAEDSTPKKTLFGLVNAWFMKSLCPQQRKTHHALTNVTSSSPPDSSRDALSRPPDLGKLLLPTSHNEANRWLLTGSNFICKNVARPSIHALQNGYSYVSFRESLACSLAGGPTKVEPLIGKSHPFFVAQEQDQDRPPPLIRFNAASTPRGMEVQAALVSTFLPQRPNCHPIGFFNGMMASSRWQQNKTVGLSRLFWQVLDAKGRPR
jgi:hypothetical protein